MSALAGQTTDRENSKPYPGCTPVDNALKTGTLGKLQDIAGASRSGQNQATGSGATPVTASIK